MIATPAVDIHDGCCVQLVGGRAEEERVSLPDPIAEARGWYELGFRALHVVDLDAAMGKGDNLEVIHGILGASDADIQIGGGIRENERADALLSAGAGRIVVGTRAVADRPWLTALVERWPSRVVVAVDTRGKRIVTRGWTEETDLDIRRFLPGLARLELGGVLWTDVGREGRLEGIDRDACRKVIEASAHPVWISGGVTTIEELEFLEEAGAHAVVLGMALYTDTLDRDEVADRWGATTAKPLGADEHR